MSIKKSIIALSMISILSACQFDGDDGKQGEIGAQGQQGEQGIAGENAIQNVSVQVVGRFSAGGKEIAGKSAAEIVQFHQASNSAFAINSAVNQIEIIPLGSLPATEVANPITDTSLVSTAFTFPSEVEVLLANNTLETITLGDANSIDIFENILAIAVQAVDKTQDGAVLFYQLDNQGNGTFIKAVKVGSLPDMLTFTTDGKKVLIANEGEPNSDYSIDPEGSISIINLIDAIPADISDTINLSSDITFSSDLLDDEDFDSDAKRLSLLKTAGLKLAGPVNTTLAQSLEPEYISVSDDNKMAFVSFQENNAIGIINLEANTIEVKPLGFKSWQDYQIDFTNKDEVASFEYVENLYGMFQPDTITTYQWNGATFILSANEGDSRDYDGYSEEVRVKDIIDPDELNKALSPELQAFYDASGGKNGLGRLKVTTALGDADQDGIYEALYAYGARSFSIWDQQINLVFDSGDDFGKISSSVLGNNFNSTHTKNKGDNRSDDKGGEPEAIAVGTIGERTYGFIASERSGDLFVYDITNPFNVSFSAYYNNRDFTVDYELDDDLGNPCDSNEGMDCTHIESAGDLGPESIKFVASEKSPNGMPLLIIGNEVSGSVTVYQVITE
ncbi:MAG: choice-of-anchor I family protein [Colwellia sp.]|nr:choice-of-anchor I family protein [Colwellia sp.]MCW9083195.1 choice-of-anchor I family protein [Colwellia sp.]